MVCLVIRTVKKPYKMTHVFTQSTICTNIKDMKIGKGPHPNIIAATPFLEGVIKLFYPYAEGVIHDLQQGKIVASYNNISKRNIGDPSAIKELGIEIKDFPDIFEPYYKTNWDGKQLKCVSITIRDQLGAPIGLLCVNFDASVFQSMNVQLEKFLSVTDKNNLNPVERFSKNWNQQVSDFIEDYAIRHNVAASSMTKDQKATLVCEMYDHSLFNYRDAAAYVARQLGVSRTTIYNYLKEGNK
jgi:D-arginine utilization repressor